MKRSEINGLIRDASAFFRANGWTLPPNPRWDVTDFGLGDWRRSGLVLVNLAEEPEYCEKLMYAKKGMVTPKHWHRRKKEDIICRTGLLEIQVWPPNGLAQLTLKVNGQGRATQPGEKILLGSGERVTLEPLTPHAFQPLSDECLIGEVSTANDDLHDNFFEDPEIGRYPGIDEDEAPLVRLISES